MTPQSYGLAIKWPLLNLTRGGPFCVTRYNSIRHFSVTLVVPDK